MSTPTTPEEKPFNDHTPLPWTIVQGVERNPATDEYEGVNYFKDDDGAISDFGYNDHVRDDQEQEANADFAHHAIHAYYPMQAEIHRLKGMLSEGRDVEEEARKWWISKYPTAAPDTDAARFEHRMLSDFHRHMLSLIGGEEGTDRKLDRSDLTEGL